VIFVNSFFGIDKPKTLPPNVHLVGPLLSPEYPSLTPDLENFLNTHQRVVYIAFGTHMQLQQATITKILTGVVHLLHDNVIDGVIWPVASSDTEEFPSEIIVNNVTIATESILKNQHEDFRILGFAPQFSILSHPHTMLFVSHAGLDSSNEALLTGKRILNIPSFGDHFYNAANLQSSGVSIPMEITTFTITEMVEKVKLLLEDKDGQFASNVRRMQILAQINSKRIQYAADVAEQMLYAGKTEDPMKSIYQSPESRWPFWKRYDCDIYLIITSFCASLFYALFKSVQWLANTINLSAQSTKVKIL
ncbi:UDP-Glycosyltransferase/glycogen phosphorylase, partial [Basidiobolus meristosporus CBS 931.73]